MDIFGDQFYPTPKAVASQILTGLEIKGGMRVYDPSAGKGDLLDATKEVAPLVRHGAYETKPNIKTYAGEIDPALQAVLRDRGHEVVAGDVFDTPPYQYFDVILMNPPFRQGVQHLLRVYDAIARGAEIRCLLNAESVRWTWDEARQPRNRDEERLAILLRENQGTVQSLGRCFTAESGAERIADVEVALVILKEQGRNPGFELQFDPDEAEYGLVNLEGYEANDLAPTGIFEALEGQFGAALGAFADVLEAMAKADHYMSNLQLSSTDRPMMDAIKDSKAHGPAGRYVSFHCRLLEAAWRSLYTKTKLGALMTSDVREQLEERIGDQSKMAFTAKNMAALFEELFASRTGLMTQSVLKAFDEITDGHWNNRNGVQGFKSNSDYQVQNRFIMSNMGKWYGGEGVDYRNAEKLDDIERALCFLSGKKFEEIKKMSEVFAHSNHGGKKMTTTFFQVRLYKNRNMHFWWRDEELRVRFNRLVASERGYQMPETVKTGAYK